MVAFINEGLFSFQTKTEMNTQGHSIMQLMVASSNFLVTYAKGSKMDKYHNPKDPKIINKQHDIDMRNNPKIEPINRELVSINYINDKIAENPTLLQDQATSIKVVDNVKGIPTVSVRCLRPESQNKSNLFVIAFPFNGMLLPIPEDPCYRIYKGMIIPSVRPFYFNGRRYRKILYLVVEPHMALFNPEHKHHKDVISVKLDSYAIYKDRETGDEKTNHETLTVNIQENTSEAVWEYDTMDESYRIAPNVDTPLWTTFKFEPKAEKPRKNTGKVDGGDSDDSFTPKKRFNNSKPKNGQRAGYIEGNTYVTTNKHGIRKEVPLKSSNHRKNDLDRMMQESGMFDHDEIYNKRQNGNRKGKKRNNNREDYWN